MKRILHRPAALWCVLIVVMQSFLLVALVRNPGTGEPHQVPLVITAPGVVAQALAEEANAFPGDPFWSTCPRDASLRRRAGRTRSTCSAS